MLCVHLWFGSTLYIRGFRHATDIICVSQCCRMLLMNWEYFGFVINTIYSKFHLPIIIILKNIAMNQHLHLLDTRGRRRHPWWATGKLVSILRIVLEWASCQLWTLWWLASSKGCRPLSLCLPLRVQFFFLFLLRQILYDALAMVWINVLQTSFCGTVIHLRTHRNPFDSAKNCAAAIVSYLVIRQTWWPCV